MMNLLSVSGYLVTHVVDVLRAHGHDVNPLLDKSKLDQSKIAEADARIPLETALAFWRDAQMLSDDPAFGLKIASSLGEGYPTLRYALQNSATLGDAYERWARFYGLISDHGVQTLARGRGEAVMRCDRRIDAPMPAVIEDWAAGQWLSLGRRLVGESWTPIRVLFEHDAEGQEARYQEWFGAPVEFNGDHCEIRIAAEVLDLPIIGADPGLSSILDRHIDDILSKRTPVETVADQVRGWMASRLDGGDPGAATIAAALNMSERTLQRRLKDEGATTTEILTQLRKDLARQYLKDPAISITETAFLLGYSEPSAFHRAFKRWTGETPADFRNNRTA